ncbi:hypothetical protein [Nocardioides sp. T2.26MG-1]|uniref:hypothetical protein n=1 Tax=Nocardioides sp. T2.26MG-1 TaxID=3041166 RepID=UPI002477BA1C|nr:hypothetical protein [Nocardioides sp. T2.26MG-1]CAI9417241.1 hypothetical protein HIDPHFAB_02971 [Nocardioides sp. T2.26MG-1]
MAALAQEIDHLLEDLEFLAAHGVGASEAARRTGMRTAKNLDKWLRRHGQPELANRLHRQEPLALVPPRKER